MLVALMYVILSTMETAGRALLKYVSVSQDEDLEIVLWEILYYPPWVNISKTQGSNWSRHDITSNPTY